MGAGLGSRIEEGVELEVLELPVTFKPGKGSGKIVQGLRGSDASTSRVTSLTLAVGLPAAPSQGLEALPGPGAHQFVARLTQEVNLVPDTEHPAQAAAKSWSLRFGAGS